jgi:hypothetical protein
VASTNYDQVQPQWLFVPKLGKTHGPYISPFYAEPKQTHWNSACSWLVTVPSVNVTGRRGEIVENAKPEFGRGNPRISHACDSGTALLRNSFAQPEPSS